MKLNKKVIVLMCIVVLAFLLMSCIPDPADEANIGIATRNAKFICRDGGHDNCD